MNYKEDVINAINSIDFKSVDKVIDKLYRYYAFTLYAFGNGGSASLANHFVSDAVKAGVLPCAVSLNSNVELLTAYSNDGSYEMAFSDIINANTLYSPVLIAISGSGNSKNVTAAIECTKPEYSIGITMGGKLSKIVNSVIIIPTDDMQIFEDCASVVLHYIYRKLVYKNKERQNASL